jgi:Leucine-rich repeat (LRR) protein
VLPTLIFGSLNALESLNLARNHLSNIQPGAFHGANNLRRLNLSSNRLDFSLMDDGGLYGLTTLEEL